MNTVETLRQCHKIVWDYREQLKDVWPTPNVEDCLLFAFTELGEAIDAHLRTKPEYSRNHARNISVLDELADCAMMLLTALGDDISDVDRLAFPETSCNALAHLMGQILSEGMPHATWKVKRMVFNISVVEGMDLPARLTARLERIKRRVLGAVEVAA